MFDDKPLEQLEDRDIKEAWYSYPGLFSEDALRLMSRELQKRGYQLCANCTHADSGEGWGKIAGCGHVKCTQRGSGRFNWWIQGFYPRQCKNFKLGSNFIKAHSTN